MDNMKNFLKFKTRDSTCEMRKFGEEYYIRESTVWRPFRLFGVFAVVAAMALIIAAIANTPWIDGLGYQASIWDTCYDNLTNMEAVAKCPRTKSHWQNAVIGFIIFAASFGFIGSVLSFLGLFTSTLPKKIYYYHSAGEIFLICALTSVIALIIYPVAVSLDDTIQSYRLGLGYGLGWGSAFFFVAAALCMSLDELIREITRRKLCKTCLNRGNGDEETQRV